MTPTDQTQVRYAVLSVMWTERNTCRFCGCKAAEQAAIEGGGKAPHAAECLGMAALRAAEVPPKLCACGCGEPANWATRFCERRSWSNDLAAEIRASLPAGCKDGSAAPRAADGGELIDPGWATTNPTEAGQGGGR